MRNGTQNANHEFEKFQILQDLNNRYRLPGESSRRSQISQVRQIHVQPSAPLAPSYPGKLKRERGIRIHIEGEDRQTEVWNELAADGDPPLVTLILTNLRRITGSRETVSLSGTAQTPASQTTVGDLTPSIAASTQTPFLGNTCLNKEDCCGNVNCQTLQPGYCGNLTEIWCCGFNLITCFCNGASPFCPLSRPTCPV
ncbi:Oidioi.mRNA.OKI2018_I69.XSR.g15109.t1.cds [Oikopleura dioica]|uniref:Oidioi.mRNA.OKI2018_I69.XSR.g15109.t1.cds n=1 Tax=Oikopleura dioica TaxID=34765 RepID=A0ABN7SFV3_OIKDI|nr:Oidioi.mRNA.OKI2018_I69.XSR.g15109.t1.cds [Oikopleura dioica]